MPSKKFYRTAMILIERLGHTIDSAGFATSVYFIFRTIGYFTGSFILQKFSARVFLAIRVAVADGVNVYSGLSSKQKMNFFVESVVIYM